MSSKGTRTAYILTIHKNPEQVNKFIKQIIAEDAADVFIHIDKKNKQIEGNIEKGPNITILKESLNVKWGDITQVDATLLLLKTVVNTGIDYDFICFRSGQDLLVKNGLSEFLTENKGKIFMNAYRVHQHEPHAAFVNVSWPKWTRQLYVAPFHPKRVLRRLIATLYGKGLNVMPTKNPLPANYSIYNGSNWFCIPLEVAQYIITFVQENKWYYEAFKKSLVPDEFFFQTLIMNSSYKKDVENDNLMFIKFGETIKTRNNPITLKLEHVDIIKDSNEFFARKFDEDVDNLVIDFYSKEVRM